MAATGRNSDSSLLAELTEYFECPVCLSVPRNPPIFQCDSGHMLCGDCRLRVTICPQCRAPGPPGLRLYFVERLLELVPRPCLHSAAGCQLEALPGRLAQHEPECGYRPVDCPHRGLGCPARPAARQLTAHQAACPFRPAACPVHGCDVEVSQRGLPHHLAGDHGLRAGGLALSSTNQALLGLLVLSIAVNILIFIS